MSIFCLDTKMFRKQLFCVAAFMILTTSLCKEDFENNVCYPMLFPTKKVTPNEYKGLKCNAAFRPKYHNVQKRALCMLPKPTIVKLEPEHNNMSYIPESVEVQRCSGSCSRPLSCMAPQDARVFIQIPVLQKLRGLRGYKCGVVIVEEHIRCACDCNTLPSDCNNMQTYNLSTCACDCMDQDAIENCRIHNRHWDSQNCKCLCPPMQCSTPLMWVPDMCKCMRVVD